MAIKNYNKAKAKAHRTELRDIRDCMKIVREDHLQVRESRIDSAWNGKASDMFITKIDELEKHMEETTTSITKLVKRLKKISDSIESTEEKNAKV